MNFKQFFVRVVPIIALFAFGCAKNEEVLPPPNDLTFDGNSFTVTSASVIGVAINNEGHAGISLISINNLKSKVLTIDVEYSGNSSVEGMYSFPQAVNDKYLDDWLTTFTITDGSTFTSTNLSVGTVNVINNGGDNYTVVIDLIMVDGSAFKGTYTGDFLVVFNNG